MQDAVTDRHEHDRLATRHRRQRAAALVLVLVALATLGTSAATLAVFTGDSSASTSWTTGTIVNGASPTTVFNAGGMMPADEGSQTVAVANTGTSGLRYAMTSASTDPDGRGLRDQLLLTIRAGACASPGATLYSGALAGASLGSPAQGDDAGDRTVDAGDADDLCFSWVFPATSGPSFQDAATSATFTFAAEQTANNP
jgi:hypothetical protein